jgi:gliding motility-associated-like protein
VYSVSLTVQNGNAPPSTVTKTVTILDLQVNILQTISCKGSKDGSIQAVTSPSGSYTYQWNTTPVQNTPAISGLGAGTFTVTVGGNDVCPASDFVVLQEPSSIVSIPSFTPPQCGSANGTASVQPTGGTPPYSFTWLPSVSSGATATGLSPGAYAVTIRDQKGCEVKEIFTLVDQNQLNVSLGKDTTICTGEQLVLYPGNYAEYQWQDLSAASTYTVTASGMYHVQVKDNNGCMARDTIRITVDCSDVYFPNAFTPNNDGRNDFFGPLGNINSIKSYSLRIFNRWGELIFISTNPAVKWNGLSFQKKTGTQGFVWVAEYTLEHRNERLLQKGVVTVIH